MKRNDWKFAYSAGKLAAAAESKKKHHTERRGWWEAKKTEVMEKIKASGLEIHEEQAAAYSNRTKGYGAQIIIDPLMQRDLDECHQKIIKHNDLAQQYDCWHQVLISNSEHRLELDHEDFLFFFGNQQ